MTHPYCKRCSSSFCPHANPAMYPDTKRGKEARAKWDEWLKEKETPCESE